MPLDKSGSKGFRWGITSRRRKRTAGKPKKQAVRRLLLQTLHLKLESNDIMLVCLQVYMKE